MKKVFICSPYAGENKGYNEELARQLCRYACYEGYAPFAPHLLYPQFLSDVTGERFLGLECGAVFLQACDELWAYTKMSITKGMLYEIIISLALKDEIPVYFVDDNETGNTRFSRKFIDNEMLYHVLERNGLKTNED